MIEKLVEIDLPPGYLNNGTTYQSKGRWFAGNLVRFFQGTIQPVGGWTQRTITGAANVGIPNCAVAWQTNDGSSFLAYGTDTSLYVIDSGNVRHDILTAGLSGGTPYRWQLTVYGSWLIATYNLTAYNASDSLNVLVWQGVPTVKAIQAFGPTEGPIAAFGVVSTPERFLVVLRGSDPNGAAHRVPSGPIVDPVSGLVLEAARAGVPVPDGGAVWDPSGGGLGLVDGNTNSVTLAK